MAHNEFYILEKLVQLLDYKDNDLFIHIDKKVRDFDFDKFRSLVKVSNVYFIDRMDVRWGTNTQINCELELLAYALQKGDYDYFHFLSGVDLPIKSQREIHSFFEKNKGKEFIHYFSHQPITNDRIERVKYYHLFCRNLRSHSEFKKKLSQKLYYKLLKYERILKINRIKGKEKDFYHGANWFSITHELASYVVSLKSKIEKEYKHTFCADEFFLQTIVYHSKFYDNLYLKKDDDYSQNVRFIDWNRGEPYTFTIEDFDLLMHSKMLFARKFSVNLDKEVIDKIYETLIGK